MTVALIIAGLLYLFSFACIPHLLLLNKRPTATLAWLWALFLFPGIGALFYLAVGTERVRRRRKRRQRSFRRKRGLNGRQRGKIEDDPAKALPTDPAAHPLLGTASRIVGLPTDAAGEVRLLRNGEAYYEALRKGIAAAKVSIHVESFYLAQ